MTLSGRRILQQPGHITHENEASRLSAMAAWGGRHIRVAM